MYRLQHRSSTMGPIRLRHANLAKLVFRNRSRFVLLLFRYKILCFHVIREVVDRQVVSFRKTQPAPNPCRAKTKARVFNRSPANGDIGSLTRVTHTSTLSRFVSRETSGRSKQNDHDCHVVWHLGQAHDQEPND